MSNKAKGVAPMVAQLKTVLARSAPTLLEDAAGCLALVLLLVVALHLPSLI